MPESKTPTRSVPLLDVSRGNQPLRDELLAAMTHVLDSGHYIGGPDCQSFEQTIAQMCEAKFAVGCASGSDALLLALMAMDVGPGDEVIVPSFTFFATASCVARLGATPVFVDIDLQTFNIDPNLIEESITGRTKAIIPVHLFGQCCEMDKIMQIAADHNLKVVEDCCQSLGATYRGKACGSIGHVGCFSFYPTKNLGGFGDSGMITSNDADLADRIRLLANHGMRPRYYHQEMGINSRLDSMQAALLNIKAKHLPRWSMMRLENAQRYHHMMLSHGLAQHVVLPVGLPDCGHVWNQYTIRIPGGQRDSVRQKLAERKIGSEIYYPIPLHRQACFAKFASEKGRLAMTEKAANEVLSLPIFPELLEGDQEYVVSSLASIFQVAESSYRKAA